MPEGACGWPWGKPVLCSDKSVSGSFSHMQCSPQHGMAASSCLDPACGACSGSVCWVLSDSLAVSNPVCLFMGHQGPAQCAWCPEDVQLWCQGVQLWCQGVQLWCPEDVQLWCQGVQLWCYNACFWLFAQAWCWCWCCRFEAEGADTSLVLCLEPWSSPIAVLWVKSWYKWMQINVTWEKRQGETFLWIPN